MSRVVTMVTPATCGEVPAAGVLINLGRDGHGPRKEEAGGGVGVGLGPKLGPHSKCGKTRIQIGPYAHHVDIPRV